MKNLSGQKNALVRTRAMATGLLAGVTTLFVLVHALNLPDGHVKGLLRAFSEAAMVGAIADWFAVTALFRRPLGIPWHTEIIPRNKEIIASNMGEFLQKNFFGRKTVYSFLRNRDFAGSVSKWLLKPQNSRFLSSETVRLLSESSHMFSAKKMEPFIEGLMGGAKEPPDISPVVVEGLNILAGRGLHRRLFDMLIVFMDGAFQDAAPAISERITQRRAALRMMPEFVKKRISGEIHNAAEGLFAEIEADLEHPIRLRYEKEVKEVLKELESSEEFRKNVSIYIRDVFESPRLRQKLARALEALVSNTLGDNNRENLEKSLRELFIAAGKTLSEDEMLRRRFNRQAARALLSINERYRAALGGFIARQMGQWKSSEITEKLELQVGADLQYIRISGTLVGGSIGVLLYLAVRVPSLLETLW